MADADHIHHQLTIDQVADNAVIAHAIPPSARVALHGFALGARVALGDLFEEFKNPALYRPVELGELLFCNRSEPNRPGEGAALPGRA
jgi:hypothetical protein